MAIANITGNILTDSGIATSSLLPLSGGTLTGALSGTSATFSSGVSADVGSAIPSIQVKNVSTDAPFIGFYRGGTLRNTLQLLTDGSFRLTDASLVANAGLTMGALSGTSATFSTEVTSSGSQGRFGGWATGAGYQGAALEVGVSGGTATLIGYNRTSGAYIPLTIGGNTNQTTTIGGNTIVLQNNGTTALTIASTGAATFSSSVTATNYTINEASANRGGLYPYNKVLGSGTDYSVGLFSEGEIFLAPGGSATKRFTMSTTGAATFSSSVTAGSGIASGNSLILANGTNARQFQFGYSTGAGYNYFQVYDGSSFQPLNINGTMHFTSGGNVLVATTTDNGQGKLQVNGAITANNISYTGELVTNSTTFNATYYHIISGAASSGQTYTLPSPSSNNLQYVIINKSPFSQTISAGSGFTIYNMAGSDVGSITLASKARCFIIADGSGFYQIF